jgi:acyl-coenzyme A thioesterase PaaI-like protein
MPPLLSLYRQVTRLPQGDLLFSRLFTLKAPYFGTVRPHFTALRPNYAELTIRKRRRVHNHLKTVHVIAICNGLEAAMGALAEATVPRDKRWIPKGMDVSYTAKAVSDITCIAETDAAAWTGDDPDVPVRVRALREDGTAVVEGVIRLWVTDKPR